MIRNCLLLFLLGTFLLTACDSGTEPQSDDAADTTTAEDNTPAPQYTLTKDQTHNKFSRAIPPVLRVPSGAVGEGRTVNSEL